jgi:hypothetical protein
LGCNGTKQNRCDMYAACNSKADLPGYMTYGKTEQALVLEFDRTDAAWHCMATNRCMNETVHSGPHNLTWKCECVSEYYGASSSSYNCTDWKACMDKHKDSTYNSVQQELKKEVSRSLLLLDAEHHQPADLLNCTNPFEGPDCGCDAEMDELCTNNGQPEDTVHQCKMDYLCSFGGVCSSWKCKLYDNGRRRCDGIFDCTQSLLAVDDDGDARKSEAADGQVYTGAKNGINSAWAAAQNPVAPSNASGKSVLELWAEEAHVTLIGDRMRVRRQATGSASLAALDQTVSGKACCRSSR